MKGGTLAWRVLAQGRLLMLGLAWSLGPQAWRPPALALLAALVGGGLCWLLQAPALQEEARAALQGVRQAEVQLHKTQEQLGQFEQQRQTAQVAALASPANAPPVAGHGGGPWHWHRMALAAGLELQQLKPLEAPGQEMAPLQLRLRGRFHQHGAFVARLTDPAQAVRLKSYQLQAGAAGMHQAELVLELAHPRVLAVRSPWTGELPRRFEAQAQADPLGDPAPADWLQTVPAAWREVLQREPGLLERVPLSAFTLTGTLRQGEEWVALLRLEQHLHSVRAGEHLGMQRGRVQRIAEQGLWWREIVQDAAGRWNEQERFWRVGESP